MESVEIKALIDHAVADTSQGFAALYEHTVDRVFSFVAFRTNNHEDASEVTQDVFVELYKSLSRFTYQSDAAFYAFLFTIVRRQLASYYAKTKKHETTELTEEVHGRTDSPVEQNCSVAQALETLDEVSREIVVLHHWSRYTFAEIGTIINMTESAVRVRHHRARAALASILNA
ncbi:MAG: sigma-70 family RNA polymerase sigma factor [Candidatus Kaiserbacteria bacterium]|nr:sigma-70 family RNA polymerase sigma factor [Candidatus Kaiserbacteria bacterium]MCB9816653.1 sigma-70 family RNA polymerase sigma factor [Candidatus Nomurabacteria bacterium]